jgi:hypothetical protein
MHFLKSFIASAAIVATPLAALAVKPPAQGSYLISGIQTICIVADGTWHGESFSPWSGQWSVVDKTLLMRGNYTAGNDAMDFTGSTSKGYNGHWQEWHDDQSYEYAAAATLVYQGSTCTSVAADLGAQSNPSQK